jgi:hypothetical protein
LWKIFNFDLPSMVFHVFWPSDHSPGWWLDLYYSYPLYTYIYIYTYVYIYIGIYKGDDQNLWDSCFLLSTIFQIPRRCWEDNDYVYALFYSAKGRLNIDIRAKFEQLAREWKWSRIHFGRIDVDKDWG